MSRFLELLYHAPEIGPGRRDYADRDRVFPEIVADSAFRLWKPGAPAPPRGTFVVLGVATWSGYDMHLLDMLEEAMAQPGDHPAVGVFNVGNLTSIEAIREYIPNCPDVPHTPAVGIWRDGILNERTGGYHGCDIVARLFGFTAKDVAEANDRTRATRTGSLPHAS